MRAFTAREKTLIALAAVALVLLAYGFGLLRPARRTLGELRRQEADLTDRLDRAERMYREAGAAQQQIADLKAKSQAIMFQSSDVQSGMVTEIEKLSKELGVPVASIRPGETESANGSMRHPAVFKIEADLGKIAQFRTVSRCREKQAEKQKSLNHGNLLYAINTGLIKNIDPGTHFCSTSFCRY